MKKRNKIDDEVEKTLRSLDELEDIEVSPYFYTRLQAGLKSWGERQRDPRYLSWHFGFLKAVFFIFLLLLNIISGIFFLQNRNNHQENRSAYMSAFAREYSIGQSNYEDYFINN